MNTLESLYWGIFPERSQNNPFTQPPWLPADVFAFCAFALERAAAYPFIGCTFETNTTSVSSDLVIDDDFRRSVANAGEKWRTALPDDNHFLPSPPPRVSTLWSALSPYSSNDVYIELAEDTGYPPWWPICLELMLIADEASWDIGFSGGNRFWDLVQLGYAIEDQRDRNTLSRLNRGPYSISTANVDVVCVQAKSRTPSVGCTLRNLTHHLAILPPRGLVRAHWVEPPSSTVAIIPEKPLRMLLVPFPYKIDAEAFRYCAAEDVPTSNEWGWFEIDQTWLPADNDGERRNEFVYFVDSLILHEKQNGNEVNAIILPELSLDFDLLAMLVAHFARSTDIEFIISGTSSDSTGDSRNFVGIAPLFLLDKEIRESIADGDVEQIKKIIFIREKHHRWKIDPSQAKCYDLQNFGEGMNLWEKIAIRQRSLDFFVHRTGSTLTTLICEDLARVDPCQAAVRAIGPNLLIALLMDGPQLAQRWPGRYASVLADDPGTSVLSLTSFGLIGRQNDTHRFSQATGVALWKDCKTGAKGLELPRDKDALVLELSPNRRTEHTLDGRSDSQSAWSWEYSSYSSISANHRPMWILTGVGQDRERPELD